MAKLLDFLTPLSLTVVCDDNVTCVNITLIFKSPTEFEVQGYARLYTSNENGEFIARPLFKDDTRVAFNVYDIYKHPAFVEHFRLAYLELEWNNN